MTHNIDRASRKNYDFVIKQGATEPTIEAQLLDGSDTAKNLTGASVKFYMEDDDEDDVYVDAFGTVTDASTGTVEYAWSSGDTDTIGNHNAEFRVDYSGATGSNFDFDEIFPSDGYLDIEVTETLN